MAWTVPVEGIGGPAGPPFIEARRACTRRRGTSQSAARPGRPSLKHDDAEPRRSRRAQIGGPAGPPFVEAPRIIPMSSAESASSSESAARPCRPPFQSSCSIKRVDHIPRPLHTHPRFLRCPRPHDDRHNRIAAASGRFAAPPPTSRRRHRALRHLCAADPRRWQRIYTRSMNAAPIRWNPASGRTAGGVPRDRTGSGHE